MVVLPYMRGVSEELVRIYKKRQITSAMKPHSALRTILVHPKNKTDPKEGIYTIDCAGYPKKYVGETKRKLKVKSKRTQNRDRESKQWNKIYKRQTETIRNRDVGICYHRSCHEGKSCN